MIYNAIKRDLKKALAENNYLLYEILLDLKKDILVEIKKDRKILIESIVINVLLKKIQSLKDDILYYNSNSEYEKAERKRRELNIIESYLPEEFSEKEINLIIQSKIQETGASHPRDMKKLMAEVMKHIKDRTDGKTVNAIVRDILVS